MRVGPILAADAFYTDRPDLYDRLADYGVLAVEMESAALYTIAARFRARALTLLTVSDHIKTGEKTTSQEREQTFSDDGPDRPHRRHRLTRSGVRTLNRRVIDEEAEHPSQITAEQGHGDARASVGGRRLARRPGRGRRSLR